MYSGWHTMYGTHSTGAPVHLEAAADSDAVPHTYIHTPLALVESVQSVDVDCGVNESESGLCLCVRSRASLLKRHSVYENVGRRNG